MVEKIVTEAVLMEGLHVIFDGTNTAYRANMVTELTTKQGFRTSAIIGSLNIIHATCEYLSKTYDMPLKNIIMVWDKGHSARRKELYPEYKAGRKKVWTPEDDQFRKEFFDQIDVLHKNFCHFGIKSLMVDHWEGDDLIFGTTEKIKKLYPDDYSIIVSTDEDFHQLITPKIHVFSPIKRILYNYDNYQELMGFNVENYLTYKILKGDSSDSIPGINGIGDSTAKSLVKKYGGIDGLFENKEELLKSKRTAKIFTPEGLSILDRNNKLINLKDYVDITPVETTIDSLLKVHPVVNEKECRAFLMTYQLVDLLTKFKTWIDLFKSLV